MSYITDQMIDSSDRISVIRGLHILPFLCVALLWGSTDVLIAKASIQSKN